MGRIVVGVDGSENSRKALEWAAKEAGLHGSTLDVIHTYEHHPAWMTYYPPEETTFSATEIEMARDQIDAAVEKAQAIAQGVVDKMIAQVDAPNATGRAVQSSSPAETLVDESRGADMIVVGSRGRGSFTGLLLGSVSQQVAQHAEVPVVIIRDESEES